MEDNKNTESIEINVEMENDGTHRQEANKEIRAYKPNPNLKICRHCGAKIAKSANTCPKCGGKNKPPIYKRWWFWVIIVILVFSVFSPSKKSSNTTPAETPKETSAETTVEDAAPHESASPSESATNSSEDRAETDISPEFKETMDSYEAFFDEYVEFMKTYDSTSSDPELLLKYAELMSKEADMLQKMENMDESNMTTAEAAYYLQVTARIEAKLATVY